MDNLLRFLVTARVLSRDQTVSLTSVLMIVVTARLILCPLDGYTVGILALALANVNAKRFSSYKKTKEANRQTELAEFNDRQSQNADHSIANQLQTLQADVKALHTSNGMASAMAVFRP